MLIDAFNTLVQTASENSSADTTFKATLVTGAVTITVALIATFGTRIHRKRLTPEEKSEAASILIARDEIQDVRLQRDNLQKAIDKLRDEYKQLETLYYKVRRYLLLNDIDPETGKKIET